MIGALTVYWVVTGLATELLTHNNGPRVPVWLGFLVSMVVGGVWIPARAIARVLK